MSDKILWRHMWLALIVFVSAIFLGSLVVMGVRFFNIESGFAGAGCRQYLAFILYLNGKIYLGYFALATLLALLLFPLVSFTVMWRQKRQRTSGKAFVYLFTWALALLLTVGMILHVGQDRSKIFVVFGLTLYYFVQDHTPQFIWDWIARGGLGAILWIWVAAAAFHYLRRIYRKLAGLRFTRFQKCMAPAVAILLTIVASLAIMPSRQREEKSPGKTPNIVILASDSLRWDYLSCNGYPRPTTPHIDELARHGINFTDCYVPSASTTESLCSMFSSLYPHTHGIRHLFPRKENIDDLQRRAVWLPELLRRQGYRTCVVSNWTGMDFSLVDMGFEIEWLPHLGTTDTHSMQAYIAEFTFQNHILFSVFLNRLGRSLFEEMEVVSMFASSRLITEQAVEQIHAFSEGDRPFFLVCFYSTTHLPYGGNARYNRKFCDPSYRGRNRDWLTFPIDQFIQGQIEFDYSEDEIRHIRDLYAANVNEFDDCVGEIAGSLKKCGIADSTVVVIASDHGDDLFEPNCTLGHGISFKGGDHANRIPLIFRLPGQPFPPHPVAGIVRSIDIAPTMLDFLGLTAQPSWEGVSLLPYFKDPACDLGLIFYGESSYLFPRKKETKDEDGRQPLHFPSISETLYVDADFGSRLVMQKKYDDIVLFIKDRCIRTRDYKLIYVPGLCENHPADACPTAGRCNPIYKLYDLRRDPGQCRNVYGEPAYQKTAQILQKTLWEWIDFHKEARLPLGDGEIH